MKSFVHSRFALGLGTFLVGVAITLAVVWGYNFVADQRSEGIPYQSQRQILKNVPGVGAQDVPHTNSEDYREPDKESSKTAQKNQNSDSDLPDSFAGRVGKLDEDTRRVNPTQKFYFPGSRDEEDIWRDFEEQQRRMDQMMRQFFGDNNNPFDHPFFSRRRAAPNNEKEEEKDSDQQAQQAPISPPFGFGFGNGFAGGFGGSIGGAFSSAGKVSIDQREDDKFIYVEIQSKYLDKESIQVEVEDNMISVSGKMRVENERNGAGGSSRSVVISSFHQSFPVPADADPNGMEIENAPDKLVLKFPRLSTT